MAYERRPPEAMREAEMQSLKKLVDESLVLAPKYERLPLAVYRALDNHGYKDADRVRMYKAIMAEMTKRSQAKAKTIREAKQAELAAHAAPTNTSEPATSDVSPSFKVTAAVLRDARAHELRQPRSAWDPDHPENS
ncbi:MAG: hypothetical protein NTX72_00965 [Candidatus Uhrbacteria bacterium]|nr:hypothetical protein [Candidatus Uhrbacteria bacterium]